MAAVSAERQLTNEQVAEYWQAILAYIKSEALVYFFDFESMDQLRKDRVINDISVTVMTESLIKPFAKMVENGYNVYLKEVYSFLAGEMELSEEFLPTLSYLDDRKRFLELQLVDIAKQRERVMARDLYDQGKLPEKPQYTKESGQAELARLFEIKDTTEFRKTLEDGEIDKCERWLQYIIAFKEHFPQYHKDWDRWLGHRRHEIEVARPLAFAKKLPDCNLEL